MCSSCSCCCCCNCCCVSVSGCCGSVSGCCCPCCCSCTFCFFKIFGRITEGPWWFGSNSRTFCPHQGCVLRSLICIWHGLVLIIWFFFVMFGSVLFSICFSVSLKSNFRLACSMVGVTCSARMMEFSGKFLKESEKKINWN